MLITVIVSRLPLYIAFTLCVGATRMAWSQTPSPLQEWQYPGGTMLEKVFEPNIPEWRFVLGVAGVAMPLYEGSRPYRIEPAPVIDIRYRDIAFASVGEGLGVNLLRGPNYRAGIAIGYDLGRRVSDDSSRLHGLGDISAAPLIKLFGSYLISKGFPVVLRADVRQVIGRAGANGLLGDLEAYMPLPGSSRTLAMIAGPSVTLANHSYTQRVFGVSDSQAAASAYPEYNAHGGLEAVGLGFSITRLITTSWLINTDVAIHRLIGSASESPVTRSSVQGVVEVAIAYRR
jgi:outer membrane scaffolding protein for murein synthesis (MipA/OmpV family)